MVKVLIIGDIAGRFEAAVQRLGRVNGSAHGPFDAIFACGRFFGARDDPAANQQAADLLAGKLAFPAPTYFITAGEAEPEAFGAAKASAQASSASNGETGPVAVASNLHYLGDAGLTTISGLRVAFASGGNPGVEPVPSAQPGQGGDADTTAAPQPPPPPPPPSPLTAALVQRAKEAVAASALQSAAAVVAAGGVQGVDVLLTAGWPAGVHHHTLSSQLPDLSGSCGPEATSRLGWPGRDAPGEGDIPAAAKRVMAASVVGSSLVSELCVAVRPRYHFAAGHGVFWQRPPFVHNRSRFPSRFIALGATAPPPASGQPKPPKSAKFLHALSLVPLAQTSPAEAGAPVAGATPCPFADEPLLPPEVAKAAGQAAAVQRISGSASAAPAAGAGGAGGQPGGAPGAGGSAVSAEQAARLERESEAAGATQYFFQQRGRRGGRGGGVAGGKRERRPANGYSDGPEAAEGVKLSQDAALVGATSKRRRRELPTDLMRKDCWFCMSSPSFAKELVVHVADHAYLTLPKGGVDNNHLLIVPLPHTASMATAAQGVRTEVALYKEALRKYYASKGLVMCLFERVVHTRGSPHAHLQVFGVPKSQSGQVRHAFEAAGHKLGFGYKEMEADADVADEAGDEQYFYVEVPPASDVDVTDQAMSRLFHKVQPGMKHPLQFGREVVCSVLGCPDRRHWKDCVLSAEQETETTAAVRAAFQPFDFLEDDGEEDDDLAQFE